MNCYECAICLQDIDEPVVLECARGGCASVYHAECAQRALDSLGNRCPVCRRTLSTGASPISHFWHECARDQIRARDAWKEPLGHLSATVLAMQRDLTVLQQENERRGTECQQLVVELQVAFKELHTNYENLRTDVQLLLTTHLHCTASPESQCSVPCNIFVNALCRSPLMIL
uniref:RING-type domain-containing protein n=1 Tax=viral metagenome TaxID=1070528 RepID=A0A6C0BZ39_9ZZZZ